MCRLTAYIGPAIPLENIVVSPAHSLVCQSRHCIEAKLAHNGDGFGIAWYGEGNEPGSCQPGLYRDVLPAWADTNLASICRMVKSPLFLAHVRAATGGGTSRENCHPFVQDNWSFMHNGQIGNFDAIRRRLESLLPDRLYRARKGSTDSELFFLLALAFGLAEEPRAACERVLLHMIDCQNQAGGQGRTRFSCVMSDGVRLFGFRYSSDGQAPTLYQSRRLAHGGFALASEPLDGDPGNWQPVAEGRFLTFENGQPSLVDMRLAGAIAA